MIASLIDAYRRSDASAIESAEASIRSSTDDTLRLARLLILREDARDAELAVTDLDAVIAALPDPHGLRGVYL
jgi:hypothetical protein